MKTYALKIISPEDEPFVMDILHALEGRHLIDFSPVSFLGISGNKLSEEELREAVKASKESPSYSLEEAKKYLGI
ncbi:MAG: hypothetical protein EAZ14_02715 [Runella slithyformis]|jgi:hypothetical protein|nr:MAG: hypothetical protein EAZ50_08520 [Runella slithyformis]TAG22331.1 MAG: hypothetical protein EAZ38_06075 [Cytophagales bacterium]TAG41376.1 MAG: hypothetical protein EAZ32_03280 [Cytophagia bacterium]TAG83134.1 MAG: hypothetical protein EAZ22_03650 [Cytophagales bacterium]TAH14988.1 MAG: hypothetical protein EAZ14_02715 [Runella slithyformis]